MREPFQAEQLQDLAKVTRLYARSKGLTLVGQGAVFTAGLLPLLQVMRMAPVWAPLKASGLYLATSAVFLLSMWIGLKLVPRLVDRLYYQTVGNAMVAPPTTPDWARLLAPLFLMVPIGLAGCGFLDAWQTTVIALTQFGLYMFVVGKFRLREPATELIGATTVLLGGIVAAEPRMALVNETIPLSGYVAALMQAQWATLAIVVWLVAGWIVSAVALHAYNRWLLAEMGREARGEDDL